MMDKNQIVNVKEEKIMTSKINTLFSNKLGTWIFWIISGVVFISTRSAVFLILPILYTTQQNKKMGEMDK
jgi:hypothetical protein